ncbi:putative glycerol kinase [Leptospira broomii serovar Hurstbridge str. 5399]|uniref:Glycerol kinase 5 n=1 Tax=Leptospira broomii serovar Hurstbridge str. 5399 TaxID=1049789 RepID=T0F7Y4_9LEPT|nr:FGGY family carbohydrate kinase [Leptospira broomii]EQA44011.1 putative glycerol kinase [Leptospira broomii serovar Hurstbridge str. 5399]
MAVPKEKFILSIDSGGSGIRAILFDKKGRIVERQYEKTPPILKSPGALEHDPDILWKALLSVVGKALKKKQFQPSNIAAIGICNQRGSFLLWDKQTGKPLTKLISWADVRAVNTADEMNANKFWKTIQFVSRIAGAITRHPMMIATYLLKFTTDHASVRLKWVFDTHPELLVRAKKGEILFGTLDTWFVYKLTKGKIHITDASNATVTGMFNPFQLQWNAPLCLIFGIPTKIFPEVKDTGADFGVTDPSLFGGSTIPIHAVIGDQMAALYGHCCFEKGGVKISQGSGAFVDMNMGDKPKISKRGLFPLVAWQLNGKPKYMLEGYIGTAGTLIDWLGKGIGLSDTPKVLNDLASQTEDTEGVVFVPTAAGMRFPHFNPRAKASVFGLSLATHRRHVARAVLEGIALSLYEILEGIKEDTKVPVSAIMVDGGVSQSDILLQCLADFCRVEVKRAPEPDMTATGAAYIAGLASGFWKNEAELKALQKGYKVFLPKMNESVRNAKLIRWKKAVDATLKIE